MAYQSFTNQDDRNSVASLNNATRPLDYQSDNSTQFTLGRSASNVLPQLLDLNQLMIGRAQIDEYARRGRADIAKDQMLKDTQNEFNAFDSELKKRGLDPNNGEEFSKGMASIMASNPSFGHNQLITDARKNLEDASRAIAEGSVNDSTRVEANNRKNEATLKGEVFDEQRDTFKKTMAANNQISLKKAETSLNAMNMEEGAAANSKISDIVTASAALPEDLATGIVDFFQSAGKDSRALVGLDAIQKMMYGASAVRHLNDAITPNLSVHNSTLANFAKSTGIANYKDLPDINDPKVMKWIGNNPDRRDDYAAMLADREHAVSAGQSQDAFYANLRETLPSMKSAYDEGLKTGDFNQFNSLTSKALVLGSRVKGFVDQAYGDAAKREDLKTRANKLREQAYDVIIKRNQAIEAQFRAENAVQLKTQEGVQSLFHTMYGSKDFRDTFKDEDGNLKIDEYQKAVKEGWDFLKKNHEAVANGNFKPPHDPLSTTSSQDDGTHDN